MENLRAVIDECLADPKYAQGRAEVKAETWEHFSNGAVRVADYLIEKYEQLNPEEKTEENKKENVFVMEGETR